MQSSAVDMNNPFLLVAVASAVAAWVAAYFAYAAARVAKREEVRRKPVLIPYLTVGYFKKVGTDNSRIFGLSASFSNRSDSDNAVAYLELEVRYKNPGDAYMKVKVPHEARLADSFGAERVKPFDLPARIDAHQTVAGWALFNVSASLLGSGAVETYTLILTDSHGVSYSLSVNSVKEFLDV